LIVYLSASAVEKQIEIVKEIGEVVGTSISAFFLISIAIINIVILRGVWNSFQQVRKGRGYAEQSPDMLLAGGLFGPDLPSTFPDALFSLAHVSDWLALQSRVRYGK
jgi:high-affinity nickel permease